VGIEPVGVRMDLVKLEVLVLDVKSRPDILVHRVAQTYVLFLLARGDVARMLALHILPRSLNDEAQTEGRGLTGLSGLAGPLGASTQLCQTSQAVSPGTRCCPEDRKI
jgi:hypothetical protein